LGFQAAIWRGIPATRRTCLSRPSHNSNSCHSSTPIRMQMAENVLQPVYPMKSFGHFEATQGDTTCGGKFDESSTEFVMHQTVRCKFIVGATIGSQVNSGTCQERTRKYCVCLYFLFRFEYDRILSPLLSTRHYQRWMDLVYFGFSWRHG
jgi:hypothetical protein